MSTPTPQPPRPAAAAPRDRTARRRRLDWRRFDTLGLRLFVLMWLTLVLSHLLAYSLAMPLAVPGGPAISERLHPQRLPTLPSLPPGGPFGSPAGRQGGMGGPPEGQQSGPSGGLPPGGSAGPGGPPDRRGLPGGVDDVAAPQRGPWPDSRPGPGPGSGPGPGPGPSPRSAAGAPDAPRGNTGAPPDAGPGGPPGQQGLPAAALWLDYGLRMAVIALGAALGARWLARPMRRLATASRELSQGLARGQPPPVLDEGAGTREVRDAAQVFNAMAARLQEQFDARGMHLASVSHDLRTPLTRLRMRLEDAPPALGQAAAGDIHEMSEMIDSTLEVLREQREGGQTRAVDMCAMLQAIVDDFTAAGHDVLLDCTAEPPHALARPAALKRIVGNLVGNALRYGGHARITLQPAAADGSAGTSAASSGIAVIVDDSGLGIPPDQLELAFRPWVRLTTAHARSGHGLGLAIARDLAERDGGSITLANRQPHGLQARLWLPPA